MIRIVIEIGDKVTVNQHSPENNARLMRSIVKVSKKPKTCIVCGKEFFPNGNRQVKCSKDCKPEQIEPIEVTLASIEEARKKPINLNGE